MTLTPTQQLVARLVLLGIGVVLLETTVVSELEILHATAALTPLVCAAVGLLCGSITGAAFGFGVGVFLDIAARAPMLGLSSLAFLAIGFACGRLREQRDPQAPITPMALGAAATLGSVVALGLMNALLGLPTPFGLEIMREIASTTVLNALIAIPVFSLTRRVLAPVIPSDLRRRRRRSYTTGGLSPLSRP